MLPYFVSDIFNFSGRKGKYSAVATALPRTRYFVLCANKILERIPRRMGSASVLYGELKRLIE
jgi:hypothetical protein